MITTMNCAKYCVLFLSVVLAASFEITNDTFLENSDENAAWSVYMDVAAEAIREAKTTFRTCDDTAKNCAKREALTSHHLEVADEMIKKSLMNYPSCDKCKPDVQVLQQRILDCSDLLRQGFRKSGVYRISAPINRAIQNQTLTVYCDMETDGGGWTVIQRRGDFGNSVDYFYKEWKLYKLGFGDIEKEFWLGNDIIHALTTQRLYSARFDLEDVNGNTRYANYDEFSVGDENSQYLLYISNYSGDAGDSMADSFGMKFSASDRDNDLNYYHCAQWWKGAWWYNSCFHAHLNGQKLKGVQGVPYHGIIWQTWKGYYESLERSEIKIRPKNFKL